MTRKNIRVGEESLNQQSASFSPQSLALIFIGGKWRSCLNLTREYRNEGIQTAKYAKYANERKTFKDCTPIFQLITFSRISFLSRFASAIREIWVSEFFLSPEIKMVERHHDE